MHTHDKETETGTDKRERQRRGDFVLLLLFFFKLFVFEEADALCVGFQASHLVSSCQEYSAGLFISTFVRR